jgi:hypothetical protein
MKKRNTPSRSTKKKPQPAPSSHELEVRRALPLDYVTTYVCGVAPYWTGKNARQSAVDFAKARAKFGRGEIRVLDQNRSIERIISFDRGKVNCEVAEVG